MEKTGETEGAAVKLSGKQRRLARRARRLAAAKEDINTERKPSEYSQIEHRLKHDSYTVGGADRGGLTVTTIKDPLCIDKMLANKIINADQHLSGIQIITLWTLSKKPIVGGMNFSGEQKGFNHEQGQLNRMNAEDQFFRTMMYLAQPQTDYLMQLRKEMKTSLSRKDKGRLGVLMADIERLSRKVHGRWCDLICLICFDEIGVIRACTHVGIPINEAAESVRAAFDCLGEALAKMRSHKKTVEKKPVP